LTKGFNQLFKQVFNLFKITREINMKRTLLSFAVLGAMLATGMTQAGGFDRTGQDTSIMLKEGSMVEITSVSVNPKITGTQAGATPGTGEVAPNYSFTNLGFRTNVSDNFAIAIIQENPFGANIDYTLGTVGASWGGLKAKVESSSTTLLTSYDMDNLTVYGGLKNQSLSASATNPLVKAYTITSTADSSLGYVLGVAIENPEIAMKVALTYHSKINHDIAIVENHDLISATPSTLKTTTPESFNLDFQTGIAENTLFFGTIRQVKWTQMELCPAAYKALTNLSAPPGICLKDFKDNAISYTLGLGRKFSDHWSGAVTYGKESASNNNTPSALAPTNGYSKMGLGITYTGEQATVTLGMQKVNNGDVTIASPVPASMTSNTTLVTAVKIGYKF
jgi:long-chain fatty acid transport protein